MTLAPPIRRPQDLPDLRLWLFDMWDEGRPFEVATEAIRHAYRKESGGFEPSNATWDRRALGGATLWYVSADMVDVIQAAAEQMPDDLRLGPHMVPDESGLVYFEKPLYGLDAETDDPVQVDAICWGQTRLIELKGRGAVGVQSYRKLALHDGMTQQELALAANTGGLFDIVNANRNGEVTVRFMPGMNEGYTWSWLGRSDWPYGETVSMPVTEMSERRARSQSEDRRWLAALWMLARQPKLVISTPADIPRQTRRRSERKGVGAKVLVVDVRKKIHRVNDEDGDSKHIEWSHRWIVSGHWRHQRVGPGRRERRWVWVPAYPKGPDDKPLIIKPRVKMVK